jgi:hypothetical protein
MTTPAMHPESVCQDCGGANVVWFAPNDIWNRVVGSPNGILCPRCFIVRANRAGIDARWSVAPVNDFRHELRLRAVVGLLCVAITLALGLCFRWTP